MIPIEVRGLSVSVDGKTILEDIDVSLPGGGWTALIGPNGAGKTTLLRSVARSTAYDGSIRIGDGDLATLPRRDVARMVAYVPQQPLIPQAMAVVDYVLIGRTPYIPYLGVETSTDLDVVADVLDRLDLAGFGERTLGSLSGGELQRVVLSRALAQQAPILLLDEPTSALDVGHQQQVLELMDELRTEHNLTVVSAMHDLTLAAQYADRLILLDGGKVVRSGSPDEVLTEETIAAHYGARVSVSRNGGGLIVAPRRSTRGTA